MARASFHILADCSGGVVDPNPTAGGELGDLAQSVRECRIAEFEA